MPSITEQKSHRQIVIPLHLCLYICTKVRSTQHLPNMTQEVAINFLLMWQAVPFNLPVTISARHCKIHSCTWGISTGVAMSFPLWNTGSSTKHKYIQWIVNKIYFSIEQQYLVERSALFGCYGRTVIEAYGCPHLGESAANPNSSSLLPP